MAQSSISTIAMTGGSLAARFVVRATEEKLRGSVRFKFAAQNDALHPACDGSVQRNASLSNTKGPHWTTMICIQCGAVNQLLPHTGSVFMLENISIAAPRAPAHDLWLFVEEIEHRVANEFAMAVASISLAAAHSASAEVKSALAEAARRLRDFANAHRSLQPPGEGPVDLSEYLHRLCMSVARARLNERGIDLNFVGRCADIAADRCWRVGLIVSELITNSIRHAFAERGGAISVEIRSSAGIVQCRVSDNGKAGGGAAPGRGSRIVDALAEELGGVVERHFTASGTTVLLSFPELDLCVVRTTRLSHKEGGHASAIRHRISARSTPAAP